MTYIYLHSGPASRGFGWRLSDQVLPHPGLGVGAPDSSRSYFIRTRPVPRFRDISIIEIDPKTIDTKKHKKITLKIKPRIFRISYPSVQLIIRATVQTDNRLRPAGHFIDEQIFGARIEETSPLTFQYDLELTKENLRPVTLRVALHYSLVKCSDSYNQPCPTFDDITGCTFFFVTGNHVELVYRV